VAPRRHCRRLGLIIISASALLGWLTAHTEVLFADGLRYITQAKAIDQGAWMDGLVRPVDHPIYPLAIVAVHRAIGGHEPGDWQRAAQLAAAAAGVLGAVPTYFIALELFGPSAAWLACLMIYLVPFNGHLMADALSESSLLLFWSLALWASLRLLRTGQLMWLLSIVLCSVLAYLTRPEGLVVIVSLVLTLILMPLWPSLGHPDPYRRRAIGLLLAGSLAAAGPFMLMKGDISSKPSMKRLLGLAPAAGVMAVERERPLDPAQTPAKTAVLATRAMVRAVAAATSVPLLVLAPVGIAGSCSNVATRRIWLFLGIMLVLSASAMIRSHAVAGYCTPRHAVIVSWVLILAGGAGLEQVAGFLGIAMVRIPGNRWTVQQAGAAIKAVALGGALLVTGPALTAPIDSGFGGYRLAGKWLASRTSAGERVIDPKGLSLFYAGQPGYTFETLCDGSGDPAVRWLVAHDTLLCGPWDYCGLLRKLVGDRQPIKVFPERRVRGSCQVYVFDLRQAEDTTADSSQLQRVVR
jgi:4-amino-4-deoxy-L-arabinose transferase-like glycosyltransferase